MANEFKIKKGLVVNGSGSTILDVQGSQGQLFSITDQLSGSLFSVNDISGIPVLEAFSDTTVKIGQYAAEAIIVSGSNARMTGSLFGTSSWAQNSLTASYFITSSVTSASYALTASSATFAASALTASYFVTQSVANATSASYAATASSADNFLVRSNLTASNALVTGTITAQTLVVSTVSSSVVYSSGSNIFGNSTANTQTFTGSVNITGSLNVNGRGTINNLTGSLFGTASWAQNTISSSYPINVTGSTIYSTNPAAGLGMSTNNAIFIGNQAGFNASSATRAIFLGNQAGYTATFADNSNFFGYQAGYGATEAWDSTFIGEFAGALATYSKYSNFLGYNVGASATSASYSTLIGYQVGYNAEGGALGIKSNNIIIGTNITLENGRQNSINLGGLIFGTGSYSTTTGNPFSGSAGGRVGINQPVPTFTLDVSGSGRFTNGLTVTGSLIAPSITGSLFGTASWSQNSLTASYFLTSSVTSASYALTASSAIFAASALTASYFLTQSVTNATSASNAATASSADNFLVRSNLTASNALVTGTITAQTLVVSTVSSSVVYSSGSNIFGNSTANVQQFTGSLRVTGSGNHYIVGGNVGIGTVSPAEKLDVNGNIQIANAGYIKGSTYTGTKITIDNDLTLTANRDVYIDTGVVFKDGGNVGIGTTSPTAKLQVSGSNTDGLLLINSPASSSILVVSGSGNVGIGIAVPTTILHVSGTTGGVFEVDGAAAVNALYVSASGNVGIGTTTPAALLNVVKNGDKSTIAIGNTASSTYSQLLMYGGATKYNWSIGAQYNVNNALEITPSTATEGTTFSTPVVTILQGGNVGIGTTTPTLGTLQVNGNVYATSYTGSLFGTASWAQNSLTASYFLTSSVTSASYALTASSAIFAASSLTASNATNFTITNTLTFDGTLTDYNTVAASSIGSNTVFTQATGSYRSGFFKYTAVSNNNARSGEVFAAWTGSNVTFTDFATTDIGSTNDVTMSVSLSGANVLFNATTQTSGWNIRSIATYM